VDGDPGQSLCRRRGNATRMTLAGSPARALCRRAVCATVGRRPHRRRLPCYPSPASTAGSSAGISHTPYTQDQIDCPAAPDVRPRLTAVLDEGFIIAAGIEKGVGQDGEAAGVQRPFRHLAVVVDDLSDAGDGAVAPGEDGGRERRRGAEVIADDFSENARLPVPLGCRRQRTTATSGRLPCPARTPASASGLCTPAIQLPSSASPFLSGQR